MHQITLIPGDGIGPEVIRSAREVVTAAGANVTWETVGAGMRTGEESGTPLPANVFDSIARTRLALKGPVQTPFGDAYPVVVEGRTHPSVTIALRKELNLFVNVRPARNYPGVKSRFDNQSLIFREQRGRMPAASAWSMQYRRGDQDHHARTTARHALCPRIHAQGRACSRCPQIERDETDRRLVPQDRAAVARDYPSSRSTNAWSCAVHGTVGRPGIRLPAAATSTALPPSRREPRRQLASRPRQHRHDCACSSRTCGDIGGGTSPIRWR